VAVAVTHLRAAQWVNVARVFSCPYVTQTYVEQVFCSILFPSVSKQTLNWFLSCCRLFLMQPYRFLSITICLKLASSPLLPPGFHPKSCKIDWHCSSYTSSTSVYLPCIKCLTFNNYLIIDAIDRLPGPLVRIPGCSPRVLGFDSRSYQIF
jgi:hypothetical protein